MEAHIEINNGILKQAKILWDYLRMDEPLEKVDLIFCLCSFDLSSARRAAEIYKQGYANKILFSGGIAHTDDLLKTEWSEPEAVAFAKEAIRLGVPETDIIIEPEATNTGENITKGYELIKQNNLPVKSMILVQKPYMGRRTFATFKKQWPNDEVEIIVTSSQVSFDEYFNIPDVEKEKIINVMAGYLQRIKEYPTRGFQIPQDIPDNVWTAFEYIVSQGFTKHLMK